MERHEGARVDQKHRPDLVQCLPALPISHNAVGADGYDWMDWLNDDGKWTVVPAWGRDGWDMGDWPYVIVCVIQVVLPAQDRPVRQPPTCIHCRRPMRLLDGQVWATEDGANCPSIADLYDGASRDHKPIKQTRVWGLATNVEGDLSVRAYATAEDVTVALDETAFFYWHPKGLRSLADLPLIGPVQHKHTGRFSWDRLDKEGPELPEAVG